MSEPTPEETKRVHEAKVRAYKAYLRKLEERRLMRSRNKPDYAKLYDKAQAACRRAKRKRK